MKTLTQMTEELIKDAIKACSTKNKTYLRSLVRDYFESKEPEELRCIHQAIAVDIPRE